MVVGRTFEAERAILYQPLATESDTAGWPICTEHELGGNDLRTGWDI